MPGKVALATFFSFCMCMLAALSVPSNVFACPDGFTCQSGCNAVGDCTAGGYKCIAYSGNIIAPSSIRCGGGSGESVFGGVKVPPGVLNYNGDTEPQNGIRIGLISFISTLLRLFTIVAGLWFMINIVYAGYLFLSAGSDAGQFNKFKEMLYYSVVGLLVIALAYLLAGLAGMLFFGDPMFILRPALYQATAPSGS